MELVKPTRVQYQYPQEYALCALPAAAAGVACNSNAGTRTPQARSYDDAHLTTALLVVEVADTSLLEDRLTMGPIYAAAGIPEYWLVNLRDDCVEVFRAPDPAARRYTEKRVAHRGDRLTLVAIAEADVAVTEILPERQ